MRLILFFDLPTEKASQRKEYRKFVKNIKKIGFLMMQKSVYVKMGIDIQSIDSTVEKVRSFAPKEGNIMTITLTEKQFASAKIILGDFDTEVVNSDKRYIEL